MYILRIPCYTTSAERFMVVGFFLTQLLLAVLDCIGEKESSRYSEKIVVSLYYNLNYSIVHGLLV